MVTAPLDDKIILDGVTRRSVLELAGDRLTTSNIRGGIEPLEIVERKFTMFELAEAAREGRLLETFAVGTAVYSSLLPSLHGGN